MLMAGPGWIIPGALKMLGGAFLAFLALQHEIAVSVQDFPAADQTADAEGKAHRDHLVAHREIGGRAQRGGLSIVGQPQGENAQ